VNEKEHKKEIRLIKKVIESFPKEIRRQKRAYQEEMKILKAFGKMSLKPRKIK
jgi:hypothetical protein